MWKLNKFQTIALAALATAAFAAPSISFAQSAGINSLQGVVTERLAKLEVKIIDFKSKLLGSDARSIDGAFSLPIAGPVQASLTFGYVPVADLTRSGVETEAGFAVTAGAGVGVSLPGNLFVTADVSKIFIQHSKGDRQNSGVTYLANGRLAFRGTFEPEQKSDIGAVLIGAGFQF